MKIVFPITKPSGKEFKNNAEIESILEAEHIGQYGYNYSNHSWHGGIHITDKSAPWAVDKYPVRAIADGKVVVCRIGSKYQMSTYKGKELKFSNDFCLIEHEFSKTNESGTEEKFTFYSLYMHLDPIGFHEESTIVPRTLYKLKRRRNAREHPGLNGTETYLHTNSLLELNEDETPVTIPPYTFKCYTMVDNAGNHDDLAKVGTTLWIADDDKLFDIVDEDVPNYPTPIWMYKKFKGKVICKSGLIIHGEPVDNKAGDKVGTIAKGGEFEFTVDSGYKTYGTYKMAKCTFISGTKRNEGDGNSSTLYSGWIAIDDKFVTLTERTPMTLDTLHSLGSNSPIKVKAGDPIGYLGRYDVIDMESAKYFKTRKMVHFEQFSQTKPIESFLKEIFSKKELSYIRYVEDDNSDGLLDDTENPPEFFDKLSSCVRNGGQYVLSNIEPWYASKYTIVKHESEWYARSGEKTIWDKLKAIFDDEQMDTILTHEKRRVDSLVWMQDESKIGFGKLVWNWWPITISKGTFNWKRFISLYEPLHSVWDERNHIYLTQRINAKSKNNLKRFVTELVHDTHNYTKEQIAYILATTKLESYNYKKQEFFFPISELGGDNYAKRLYDISYNKRKALSLGNINQGDGVKFKGRGFVQITGRSNYKKFSAVLKINLETNPDLALQWETAYKIATIGISDGIFTGYRLDEFINKNQSDYYNARKIINSLDKADVIRQYSEEFYKCLKDSM